MKINKQKTALNIILLIGLLAYVYFAYRNQIIPFRYQFVVALILALLCFIAIAHRRKRMKLLIIALTFLLSFGHIKAQDMLGEMFVTSQQPQQVKKATVSMIALPETKDTQQFYKEANYATSYELDVDFHQYIYNDLAEEFSMVPNIRTMNFNLDLVQALYNQEIDVMILDETKRDEIIEQYPNFSETTKVLRTFEKEIILESNAIKVNPKEESFVVLLTANDNWGEKDAQSLADVNILAIVNPKLSQFTLVSVPRDTFVPLACKDQAYDKLTHTGFYGIDCQIETISNFMGVDINYYAKVNFGTLVNIINIIGGSVNVYNPYAFQGHTSEYYFEEGCLNLDALATLNYVRTRYELPDGDFGRQENQKRVIKSLTDKLTSPHRILNMGSLFSELSKEVETNIDVNFVNAFVSHQLDKWPNWQMNSRSFGGYDGNEITFSFPYEYLYVFLPDHTELNTVRTDIKQFMNAKSIEEVDFLNPEPVIEETPPQSEVDVQPNPVAEETAPQNDVVQQSEPQEPMSTPEPEIYKPIIDNSIEKFGIHIFPFELENQDTFTKQQYIEACEASYGW